MKTISIAVHGGAGTILRSSMTREREAAYMDGIKKALDAGFAILSSGASAMDAVEVAIIILENDPLYNAGKGSVFTFNGTQEMDACIMDGSSLSAGSITNVQRIKNPISLARKVMENSPHVFLSGQGAEEFGRINGVELMPENYFFVQERYDQYLKIKDSLTTELDHFEILKKGREDKFGTVGAVALDSLANVAAGTSTGGMTNKRWGRVGDTPVIGAGTYANNKTCAVSCTGHGEFFIRNVVGYDVSCLMEYKGLSLQGACEEVIYKKLKDQGGRGGLIAVDGSGNIALPFNTEGMYRGFKNGNGDQYCGIF